MLNRTAYALDARENCKQMEFGGQIQNKRSVKYHGSGTN